MYSVLTKQDILVWDVHNWANALRYWEEVIPDKKPLMCLEIGANRGGLSMWLASKGHHVICSDIRPVSEDIKRLHMQ